jgi:hypothetical protein
MLHLPHLLRVLGPSSLMLYKLVLGCRRILVYTQLPIEPACEIALEVSQSLQRTSCWWALHSHACTSRDQDGLIGKLE